MVRVFISLLLFLTFNSQYSHANIFDYKDGMQVTLGETWDPLNPYEKDALSPCFDSTRQEAKPIGKDYFNENFLESLTDVETKSAIDIHGSGSGKFGIAKVSTSASYSKFEQIFSEEKNIVYSLSGSRTYYPQSASFVLNQRGKQLLQSAKQIDDGSEFYRKCGNYLVTSITRETKLSVVYIFRSSSVERVKEVKSAISASFKKGAAKAKGSASIMSDLRAIDDAITVDVLIYQNGVLDGSDALNGIIAEEPGDVASIRSSVKAAIAEISYESSPVKKFNASPISNYYDIPKKSSWKKIDRIYDSLGLFERQSQKLVARYLELEKILNEASLSKITFKKDGKKQLLEEMDAILDNLDNLSDKAEECFDNFNKRCRPPLAEVRYGVLQYVDVNWGTFNRWEGELIGGGVQPSQNNVQHVMSYRLVFSIENEWVIRELRIIELKDTGRIVRATITGKTIKENASNGEFSTDGRWTIQLNKNTPCWGQSTNDCYALLETQGIKQTKYLEAGKRYEVEVVDIEGNSYQVPIENIDQYFQ